jgi:hypothetical protein
VVREESAEEKKHRHVAGAERFYESGFFSSPGSYDHRLFKRANDPFFYFLMEAGKIGISRPLSPVYQKNP